MDFPSLMPQELQYTLSVANEEALYRLLLRKPGDLILFFETACDDETWTESYFSFMRMLLEYLTEEALQEHLTDAFIKQVANAVWKHHQVVTPIVPQNIQVDLKDQVVVEVNALLLINASPFFKHFLRKCRETKKMVISLTSISQDIFNPIREFIATGAIVNLWRKEPADLIILLKQANSWQMDGVAELCEKTLKRYLDQNNIFEMLAKSMNEHWPFLKKGCLDFINKDNSGAILSDTAVEKLTVKFERFSDESIALFRKVNHLTTDLVFVGELIENALFAQVVQQCPKLSYLDLTGTSHFSNYFSEIPDQIQSLNLSQCSWAAKESLRRLATICPNISELLLSGNSQMNFNDWGELLKFKQLKKLDVSRCHSIRDEDLAIILKACPVLSELNLDDCDRINEPGFFEIAKHAPKLLLVNLSRTNISDAPILDIAMKCRSLHTLILSRCEQLSEKSIASVVKYGKGLRVLDVSRCQLAKGFLDDLKQQYSHIKIIG